MRKLNLLFLGPPGVGKSTYAKHVAKHLKVPAISFGGLLRQEVEKGTLLSKKIQPYIDHGKLVPTVIVDKILIERLKQDDCKKGFILDGTLTPLERAHLLHSHIKIDYVIYFKAPKKELLARISGRKKRSDDTSTVIENRINAYKKRNSKLRRIFKKQGILEVIDARPPIDEIVKQTISVINKYRRGQNKNG